MHQRIRKWSPLLLVGTFVLLIDQLVKGWVVNNLAIGESIRVIPALHPYFQFTRSMNTGFAFGIGSGGSALILLLSIVIIIMLLFFYAQTQGSPWAQWIGLRMVIGGALGNVIDRIRYGHVVDFFHLAIPDIIANVSNFADHFIVLGVALLLIDSFLQGRRRPQPVPAEAEAQSGD